MVPESLIYAGHTDEDHRQVGSVVVVTEEFKGGGAKPLGFIGDEELQ